MAFIQADFSNAEKERGFGSCRQRLVRLEYYLQSCYRSAGWAVLVKRTREILNHATHCNGNNDEVMVGRFRCLFDLFLGKFFELIGLSTLTKELLSFQMYCGSFLANGKELPAQWVQTDFDNEKNAEQGFIIIVTGFEFRISGCQMDHIRMSTCQRRRSGILRIWWEQTHQHPWIVSLRWLWIPATCCYGLECYAVHLLLHVTDSPWSWTYGCRFNYLRLAEGWWAETSVVDHFRRSYDPCCIATIKSSTLAKCNWCHDETR